MTAGTACHCLPLQLHLIQSLLSLRGASSFWDPTNCAMVRLLYEEVSVQLLLILMVTLLSCKPSVTGGRCLTALAKHAASRATLTALVYQPGCRSHPSMCRAFIKPLNLRRMPKKGDIFPSFPSALRHLSILVFYPQGSQVDQLVWGELLPSAKPRSPGISHNNIYSSYSF